jgi:hypothetical protein
MTYEMPSIGSLDKYKWHKKNNNIINNMAFDNNWARLNFDCD